MKSSKKKLDSITDEKRNLTEKQRAAKRDVRVERDIKKSTAKKRDEIVSRIKALIRRSRKEHRQAITHAKAGNFTKVLSSMRQGENVKAAADDKIGELVAQIVDLKKAK